MQIQENYERIEAGIAGACKKAGRKREDVTLLAVTKFVETERIAPALALGIKHIGENRVQELLQKQEFFEEAGVAMHLIGQLQSNKVKYVVGLVASIQSVDRLSLAQEIQRQAEKKGVVQPVFIEVNIGGEEQKGGVAKEELFPLIDEIAAMPHIALDGLMCIPPALDEEAARPYFAKMYALYERVQAHMARPLTHLSMGMSGDYKAAIEEGATMVRVGSALFGARQY